MKSEQAEERWRTRIGWSIGELKTRLKFMQKDMKRIEGKLDRLLPNNRQIPEPASQEEPEHFPGAGKKVE